MAMSSFSEVDAAYRSAIEAAGRELPAAFTAARGVPVILDGDDLTRAVLLRLRSFLLTQDLIKAELNKVYAAPAADFFVETVAFFLSVALSQLTPHLTVKSEKNIVPKAGSLRPDITVWGDHGEVVASIECKTQLGWNRGGWRADFEDRERRLRAIYPNAKQFLLVMTGSNWGGFAGDLRAGEQFFVLLRDVWPREFNEAAMHLVVNRIEELIGAIVAHARE